MKSQILDNFASLADWTAVTSGQARLDISQDTGPNGKAMRLDFDFGDGGGFVVARKPFALQVPEAYAYTFSLRGAAPLNKFEFKMVDPSGHNVWRYQQDAFAFPADWQALKIRGSQIDFAWGPAGGGSPGAVGAIELVIAAPPGGKGSVWFADLCLEDHCFTATPLYRASSVRAGYEANIGELSGATPSPAGEGWGEENQNTVYSPHPSSGGRGDGSMASGWCPEPSDAAPWLQVDFQEEREFGGLVLDWQASASPFSVQISGDGHDWQTVYRAAQAQGQRSFIYLPQCTTRWLRIALQSRTAGIARLSVKPYDFSRSIDAFFNCITQESPRGFYPRYMYGEQSYWTPAGVPEGLSRAVLNEEGMLEVDEGSFSLMPFLYVNKKLLTWADVRPEQQLERGYLPIPSALWHLPELVLTTTAFASGALSEAVLYVRYRLKNTGQTSQSVRLFAAIQPFQVTPPWQAFGKLGGTSPIKQLVFDHGIVRVDDSKTIIPLTPPTGFGAAAFEQGAISEYLKNGCLPAQAQVVDEFGYAAAALSYDLELAAGAQQDIYLAVPFAGANADRVEQLQKICGEEQFATAVRTWEAKLATVSMRLPPAAQPGYLAFKTAAAHILLNRYGAAIQPGPRRYVRSWIRDGATMAAALSRIGCVQEAGDYVRWYAPFIAEDGNVPCAVDRSGPDWLEEFDSQGQFIHAVLDYYRLSGDRAFLREMWPIAKKALAYLEALRSRRLTPEFQTADKRACYGLLPESVSHEGYLAQPVHAYWDDFWALRGLEDAAILAELSGEPDEAERLHGLSQVFRDNLGASIETTMAQRDIAFLPGSVEWADFDPTATANAISLLDNPPLPAEGIKQTFDRYLSNFRQRNNGEIQWTNYTPYEIRVIDALVRLDQRQDAHELLRFFLSDRRPLAWNQWPEIAWREPRTPGHLGDVPHSWIGAEFVLAFRGLFVYERESEHTLVLAAGISSEWLADGFSIAVHDLPTCYGKLSYSLCQEAADRLRLKLSGDLAAPLSRLLLKPPLARAISGVEVNGKPLTSFEPNSVSLEFSRLPLDILVLSES